MNSPPLLDEEETRARPWSLETETRADVTALLLRRSALTPGEVLVFRVLYTDIYDTYVETLRCVVRSRGARAAVVMELVHDALVQFWDETVAEGFPESIQAKLLSLASGLARNQVRRTSRNPATGDQPTSSKEAPGSFPRPDRTTALQEVARVLVERLSPDHQAIIDAVVLHEETVTDAARRLGLQRTTAASRLTAALALLLEMAESLLSPSDRCW